MRTESVGQFHHRHRNLVKAYRFLTYIADKMNVIILMMLMTAVVTAQCIQNSIIRGWNLVNEASLHKSLQGAVNGDAVEESAGLLFYIGMGERAGSIQEHG